MILSQRKLKQISCRYRFVLTVLQVSSCEGSQRIFSCILLDVEKCSDRRWSWQGLYCVLNTSLWWWSVSKNEVKSEFHISRGCTLVMVWAKIILDWRLLLSLLSYQVHHNHLVLFSCPLCTECTKNLLLSLHIGIVIFCVTLLTTETKWRTALALHC